MKKSILLGGLAAAVTLLPVAAFADLASEISIAKTHAGLAAKATAIDGVHMHLHHALNCLVGPQGADFDKSNENPCEKAGKGIQADGGASAPVNAAIAATKTGLADTDLAKAQKDATAASAAIAKIPAK